MVEAGIDHALKFRHLSIVRTTPTPGGNVTQKLTDRFQKAGGRFLDPGADEFRTLHAIFLMKQQGHAHLKDWFLARKPVSGLPFIRQAVPSPLLFGPAKPAPDAARDEATNGTAKPTASTLDAEPTAKKEAAPKAGTDGPQTDKASTATPESGKKPEPKPGAVPGRNIPLGRRLIAGDPGEPLFMPVGWLEKHAVVFAGAGSGKTVLLKRLIEEAALLGHSLDRHDGANDLAALDESWPSAPDGWAPGDAERASRYHSGTEVLIWTPGKESGNPLALEPLPDLAAVAEDKEELQAAVEMAAASLSPIVAPGNSMAANHKKGILTRSLRFFGRHGGGPLKHYIGLLDEFPAEAGLGVANEEKMAKQMADTLKVAVETNPLLRSQGTPLDPAVLFGDDRPSPRTRLSVINLVGLQSQEAQRHFLNELAMTLFSWIKKNPNPGGRPLRGLLVIDEARDFVPSQKSSACKESLTRLVAQARKYHLGIIFATQNPKDIETKIVANCSTQYYGKVNAPAAIEAVKDQIKLKGGSGNDVPQLSRGRFYVHNADLGLKAPAKVAIPLCLSKHPDNPLDEARILEKAAKSRVIWHGGG